MRKEQTEATRQFYIAVGKRIADARRKLPNKTQEALAAELGVGRATVVNIERGRQQLLLHTIVRIADCLKVPLQDLIPELSSEDVAITNFVQLPEAIAWIESSISAD